MTNLTNFYLMTFEPKKPATSPINDDITRFAKVVFNYCIEAVVERGDYSCCGCNEPSQSVWLQTLGTRYTHPLLVHYVSCHRDEIPEGELIKLQEEYQLCM